jgi:hypothetical protein
VRKRLTRDRGFVAIVCLVVVIALAMAPIVSSADCAVLVPLPELFAAVISRPIPAPEPPRVGPILESSPLPLRAPPIA